MKRNETEARRLNLASMYALVSEELDRQKQKWGVQEHTPDRWLAIASEEYGEVARAVVEFDYENYHLQQEIISTIACLWQLHQSVYKHVWVHPNWVPEQFEHSPQEFTEAPEALEQLQEALDIPVFHIQEEADANHP